MAVTTDDLSPAEQGHLFRPAGALTIGRAASTQRELEKVFGLHGITRIASTGLPLDPNQHQAMLEVPSDDAEPGTVVQEMQSGYMIKDRLLRPAMVAVAKKPG